MRGSNVIDRSPPVTGTGGGDGRWAWLLTVNGHVEAQLVRGMLETAGIVRVLLDATDPSPGAWMFPSGNPNALVRIYVPKVWLDDARLILLDAGVEAPDEPARDLAPVSAWPWIATAIVMIVVILAFAYLNGMRTVL